MFRIAFTENACTFSECGGSMSMDACSTFYPSLVPSLFAIISDTPPIHPKTISLNPIEILRPGLPKLTITEGTHET